MKGSGTLAIADMIYSVGVVPPCLPCLGQPRGDCPYKFLYSTELSPEPIDTNAEEADRKQG